MSNMEQLCKFSFIDWIESVYPSEDDTNAKEEIYKFFSDSLQNNAAWPVLKESFKTNLDMFTVLCKSDTESVDVEAISLLCESMEKIKYTCIEKFGVTSSNHISWQNRLRSPFPQKANKQI